VDELFSELFAASELGLSHPLVEKYRKFWAWLDFLPRFAGSGERTTLNAQSVPELKKLLNDFIREATVRNPV
jgi:hypothetical protein